MSTKDWQKIKANQFKSAHDFQISGFSPTSNDIWVLESDAWQRIVRSIKRTLGPWKLWTSSFSSPSGLVLVAPDCKLSCNPRGHAPHMALNCSRHANIQLFFATKPIALVDQHWIEICARKRVRLVLIAMSSWFHQVPGVHLCSLGSVAWHPGKLICGKMFQVLAFVYSHFADSARRLLIEIFSILHKFINSVAFGGLFEFGRLHHRYKPAAFGDTVNTHFISTGRGAGASSQ